MADDLPRMVNAILDNDMMAAVPLLDLLQERGDPRYHPLSELMVRLIVESSSNTGQKPSNYRLVHLGNEWKEKIRLIFWREILVDTLSVTFQKVADELAGAVRQGPEKFQMALPEAARTFISGKALREVAGLPEPTEEEAVTHPPQWRYPRSSDGFVPVAVPGTSLSFDREGAEEFLRTGSFESALEFREYRDDKT